MDYLTFLTANTLIILSLCGIVYLIKQGACLVHWIIKDTLKELEEDKG